MFQNSEHWAGKCWRAIVALLLREMSTTYGRSPGGYTWAVLEPVAGIALLSVVFSLLFQAPPLGKSFPMFYATGLLPFTFYVQVYSKLMVSIWFSKPLLQYPAVSFIDAMMSRFLLAVITQIIVFYVVIACILLVFRPNVVINVPGLALALAMLAVFAGGIGVLNCLLISVFPVWQRIWNVLHRPIFLISGVFFLFDATPEPYRSILWFNPLIHIIGITRRAFYPTYDAAFASPAYVFAFGLVTLVTGLFFLRRWHKDILYQ